MIGIQECNFFDDSILVIDENFDIEIAQQVEIHFITVVADGHYKRTLFIENIYFLFKRKFSIVWPRDHAST
jgi:hypothetical protein